MAVASPWGSPAIPLPTVALLDVAVAFAAKTCARREARIAWLTRTAARMSAERADSAKCPPVASWPENPAMPTPSAARPIASTLVVATSAAGRAAHVGSWVKFALLPRTAVVLTALLAMARPTASAKRSQDFPSASPWVKSVRMIRPAARCPVAITEPGFSRASISVVVVPWASYVEKAKTAATTPCSPMRTFAIRP